MKDLVLIGGGHSNVAVLRHFAMHPPAGVRLTLVSRGRYTPYSGMLPGLVAGHYSFDDAHIDLQRLTRFAGARGLFDEVVGVDLPNRLVLCSGRPPVRFDVLSINVGSTPNASAPGAAEHATPVKPIDRFLDRWLAICDRIREDDRPKTIAIVGGGAGGVELLLSVHHRLRTLLESEGRDPGRLQFRLFSASRTILPTHGPRVRGIFERIFAERGIVLHTGAEVVAVEPGRVHASDGCAYGADEVLWTTQARAAPWIRASGLAVDGDGFVRVSPTLESTSHRDVFAAGDVAALVGWRLEKSGVYAVREGEVLADNLRRRLAGRSLRAYRPQRRFLGLISTGDRYAVGSRGRLAFEGGWVWRWKDRIDRRFMRMYNELPPTMPRPAPAMEDEMRCGGCGAKVAATILARALARVNAGARDEVVVGLQEPDDGAVVEVPPGKVMVHTVDFFRALIDDPFVFGRIAATHALGDLYAMGAEPQTALAIVTIPFGPEPEVEDLLTQLLSGATLVLRDAGAVLVGGHTSESAELGLGFSMNGTADRQRLLRKSGLRPGDRLILTKAIGTGALFAADMRHRAKGAWIEAAISSMTRSNRDAAACFLRHRATACTDVTGFGVVGHLSEMAEASGVDVTLDVAAVPLLPGAEETVRAGILSTMHPQNLGRRRVVAITPAVEQTPRFALLFDPQTAGGLLAGVPPDAADACVAALRRAGDERAAVVGAVSARSAGAEHIVCRG